MIQDCKLFIPGPCDVDEDVLEAMHHPVRRSYGAKWLPIFSETQELLKQIFQTRNDLYIVLGPGSAGLDMALGSLLAAGEKVIVPHNGFFGERLASIAEYNGLNVVHVRTPLERPLDPDDLRRTLAEHPDALLVALVHHETTTTVLNPLKDLAAVTIRMLPPQCAHSRTSIKKTLFINSAHV
jgi:alanine-glyoxylate transaminase/serine-glyoxylate transaminase/serine-pyruvate transaminase